MEFNILEIKDKDLYVIHDKEKGGVCCCSLYTIKQLLDKGHKVNGVITTGARLKIQEVGLDSKPRSKKAPNCCTNETKRSLVTIEKGLDEKHYPKVKQVRRKAGSYVEVSVKRGTVDEKSLGIQEDSDTIVTLTNGTIQLHRLLDDVKITIKVIENLDSATKEVLDNLANSLQIEKERKENLDSIRKESVKKNRKLAEEKEKLKREYEKKLEQLEDTYLLDTKKKLKEADELYKKAIEQTRQIQREYKYKGISGNEKCTYSFYNNDGKNPVAFEYIREVVQRSNRPIKYTYGLSYRNPTTHNKPISKEEAMRIIDKRGMLTIDTYNYDYIYINEVSGNDMW